MKIKKMFSGFAAFAVMASMAFQASAAGTVIDFEDGDYSFAAVHYKSDGSQDSGDFSMTVVDFNGSKQLKAQRVATNDIIKLRFEIDKILAQPSKCARITADLTLVFEEDANGWAGGAVGTSGGEENGTWGQTDWSATLGEEGELVTPQFEIERKFLLPAHRFIDGAGDNHMLIMKWDHDGHGLYTMYVDNVRFYDDNGNLMELLVGGGSVASAPETKPAPAASPATGNVPAIVIAAVLAVAGIGLFITRKRKN